MAKVFKAHDDDLDKDFALKFIDLTRFLPVSHDTIKRRFKQEARIMANLSHDNIVKVIRFDTFQGIPYFVEEYFQKGSLEKLLGKPILYQDAARFLLPIADALHHAHTHRKKIIHRDVKPANILINDDGQPMLTDFGIAKVLEILERDKTIHSYGMLIGTPQYMAPEQALGYEDIDYRVDVYAMGIVFYEMITGKPPFTGKTSQEVMNKHINNPLPPASRKVKRLPHEVDRILGKALAKNPDDRYEDMIAFSNDLKKLIEDENHGCLAALKTSLHDVLIKMTSLVSQATSWHSLRDFWTKLAALISQIAQRRGLHAVRTLLAALVLLALIAVYLVIPAESTRYVLSQTYGAYSVTGAYTLDTYNTDTFESQNAFIGGGKIYLDTRQADDWGYLFVNNLIRGEKGKAVLVKFRMSDFPSNTGNVFAGMTREGFETPDFLRWGVSKMYGNNSNTQLTGYVGNNTFKFNMEPYWDLKPGKWYYALYSFNSPYGVHVKLWERDNPRRYQEQLLQFKTTSTPRVWNFIFHVTGNGVMEIDEVQVISFEMLNTYVRKFTQVVQ
jgi:serine/threonine-protein kinase